MRVSSRAASQALAAVRTTRRRSTGAHRRHRPSRHRGSGRVVRRFASVPTPRSIDLALRTIDDLPPLRAGVVEAATARLAAGERPSSDDIAEMAIRRATCDLLR
jgi:hypothetical protein